MNQENYLKIYEFLVQVMRYWFALLAVFIVYIAAISVFRDYRRRKRLNEDETVGELRALAGGGDTVAKNTIWEFTHEAMIGSARNCDVTITHKSVLPRHVLMKVEGDHILLRVIEPDASVRINNHPYEFGTYDLAYSGDRLKVGDVVLELWLFGEEDIIEEDFADETEIKHKSLFGVSQKSKDASLTRGKRKEDDAGKSNAAKTNILPGNMKKKNDSADKPDAASGSKKKVKDESAVPRSATERTGLSRTARRTGKMPPETAKRHKNKEE